MKHKKINVVLGFRKPTALNAKVGRTYQNHNCVPGVLCNPQSEFDMIESCKVCKKLI